MLGLGLLVACGRNDDSAADDNDDDATSSGAAQTSSGSAPSSSSGGSPGGSSGAPVATGDSPLVVRAAVERTTLGGRTLRNGSFFAVVDVSVKNAGSSALAFSLANFRLVVSGLETVATPETTELENACPAAGFLTAGGTIDCSVAFEVSVVPTRIVLVSTREDSGAPVRLEADLPSFARCERCGEDSCVDLLTSGDHCGACGQEVPPEAESCENGTPSCGTGRVYCDDGCWPADSAPCDPGRVVEVETRDTTCASACAPDECLRGTAYYGPFGFPNDVDCESIPPATYASPLGGQDMDFSRLDCLCDDD